MKGKDVQLNQEYMVRFKQRAVPSNKGIGFPKIAPVGRALIVDRRNNGKFVVGVETVRYVDKAGPMRRESDETEKYLKLHVVNGADIVCHVDDWPLEDTKPLTLEDA